MDRDDQDEEKWKTSLEELEIKYEEVLKQKEDLSILNKTMSSDVQRLKSQISFQEKELAKVKSQNTTVSKTGSFINNSSGKPDMEKKVVELHRHILKHIIGFGCIMS